MSILNSITSTLQWYRHLARLKLISLSVNINRKFNDSKYMRFTCNICGNENYSPIHLVEDRESPSCFCCGSNKRFRSIVAALSEGIFDEIAPISNFKTRKYIIGYGLSDAELYARKLRSLFNYTNTFYHKKPILDITSINENLSESADFLISSDVFEHIPPPVDIAFQNSYKILKKGGLFILSVPFFNEGETIEHYPDLFKYEILVKKKNYVLINETRDGIVQRFENLKFHGGPGTTLEMRVYSMQSLIKDIERAGFKDIKIWKENIPSHGILNKSTDDSFVLSMRKN